MNDILNSTIAGINSWPRLRVVNGENVDASAPARAAALPATYNYGHIRGVNQANALNYVGAFIAIEYAKLAIAKFGADIEGAIAADDQGDYADWAPYTTAAAADAALRNQAITIGAARVTYATTWCIRAEDININERDNDPIAHLADGRIVLTSGHTNEDANITLKEAYMMSFAALTEHEAAFGFAIMSMAVGAIPACGVQLLSSGHHYLSGDTRMTAAVEKQILANSIPEVKSMWNSSPADFKDWLWHKSCHAVSTIVAKKSALSEDVVAMLNAAKLGSIAVRLPHTEDAIRRCDAYLAVVNAVKVTMSTMSSSVKVSNLEAALAATKACPHPFEISNIPWAPPAAYPDAVSRDDMITRYLLPATENAKPHVAFAAGVYSSVLERTESRRDTRLTAHSLKKLQRDHVGPFGIGKALHSQYVRFQRSAAERGDFVPIHTSDTDDFGVAGAAVGPAAAAPAPGAVADANP